jgi:hypothetical protein
MMTMPANTASQRLGEKGLLNEKYVSMKEMESTDAFWPTTMTGLASKKR